MKKIIEAIRPYILQPLSIKGCLLSNRKIDNFFLSFSNSFLCILNHHEIVDKKETILAPNFYCINQLNFIGKYLNIIFYKINDDFSVNKKHYFEQIEKHNPKIILNSEEKKRLIDLCEKGTIVIEDCAQKILSDSESIPVHKNYYYIDSIRKHCSLLGSHMINPDFNRNREDADSISWYKVKCEIMYFIYKILTFFIYIFPSKELFIISEKFLKSFNINLSNVPRKPVLGSHLSFYLYGLIDSEKIEKHNKSIILEFKKYFDNLNDIRFKTLPQDILSSSDLLNYFPVFIEEEIQPYFVEFLLQNNIFPWHLWDIEQTPYLCELNTKLYTSFLVFPIHWLITKKDVEFIGMKIKEFTNKIYRK
jgi:hypothetical protein